jgi:hypothetical protein
MPKEGFIVYICMKFKGFRKSMDLILRSFSHRTFQKCSPSRFPLALDFSEADVLDFP